jgi:hypothetical protein
MAFTAVGVTALVAVVLYFYCKRASAKEVDYLRKLEGKRWQTVGELKQLLQKHCGGWLTTQEVKRMLEGLDRRGFAVSRSHTRRYEYPDHKGDVMCVEVVEYKLTDAGAHRLSLQTAEVEHGPLEQVEK